MANSPTPAPGVSRFEGKLSRNFVLLMVFMSLLPLLLVGTTTYIRSRQLLRSQVATQLEIITRGQSDELEQIAAYSKSLSERIMTDDGFISAFHSVLADPEKLHKRALVAWHLDRYCGISISESGFHSAAIFLPDNSMLTSTDPRWLVNNDPANQVIETLLDTNQTIAYYSPPYYPDQLVVFTSFTIQNAAGEPAATVIGAMLSDLPRSSMASSKSFFQDSSAFYRTKDNVFLQISDSGDHFAAVLLSDEQKAQIDRLIFANTAGSLEASQSENGEPILRYARWIPGLQLGIILDVPLNQVFQQLNLLTPVNAGFLLATILMSALIVYFSSRRVVQPLLTVVNNVRQFSTGDWSQRAVVNRTDEIGLLAYTFNGMVEQLSDLYQSLELKVSERSRQIRIASEIAQAATASQDRNEILQLTSTLVAERFGYTYAAVYLLEESGLFATIQNESQVKSGLTSFAGTQLRLSSDTLVGWAALNNQARVMSGEQYEHLQRQFVQPGVQSEVAIPISAGNFVYGILDIQSERPGQFDPDTVAVLQTLTNQIASGLQKLQLLETTQIDLKETGLLYRTSRLISQSSTEREVNQLVVSALRETPFVTGFYNLHSDHISVIAIQDPREPGARTTSEGITIPIKNVLDMFKNTQLILIEDINQSSELSHILSFFNRRSCSSAAVIPLYENNCLAKMVVIGARKDQHLSDTTLQPFANLLAVAATTLGRIKIQQSLQERVNELQLLTDVSHEISAQNESAQFYRSLHRQIEKIVHGECDLIIALYHRSKELIEVPYASELNEILSIDPFPLGEGLTSHVLTTQKPLLINGDIRSKAAQLDVRILGRPAKSWIGIPLTIAGDVIGALIVQDTQREDRFGEEHVKLFTTLAPHIATAIRNTQLLLEMENAQQAYEQERYLLNTLLESIPDQIYFKDTSGHYLRVSNSYANQFNGANPEDLIDKNDVSLLGYDAGSEAYKVDQDLILSGEKQIGTIENHRTENGEESWQLTSRIPLVTGENACLGLLAISRDITNLKIAEERAMRTAHQLHTAAEIARDTSSTLDLNELLKKAVNLVRERFGFYHASIFLLEPNGEYARLEESTGPAGQRMKENRHRLMVGSNSMIGQATSIGEPIVLNDVSTSSNYYANPLMPETRAELAIPLKIGDRILGALDVQSSHLNAFAEQDVAILQILADQISVAVFNANLFARTQDNIIRHRLLHEITSNAALALTSEEVIQTAVDSLHTAMPDDRISIYLLDNGFLELRASAGYPNTLPKITKLAIGEGTPGRAAQELTPVLSYQPESEPVDEIFYSQLAVPIIYSHSVVGTLLVESPRYNAYDENDQEIVATLGSSLGPILYNAYLMAEVRQQVERERLIYEATSRIHRSVDIQSILKTSAAELSKAVGARSAQIEIMFAPAGNNGNHLGQVEEKG
jgi:PAS domain S-box-containing protein